jgi:hypothetical protein
MDEPSEQGSAHIRSLGLHFCGTYAGEYKDDSGCAWNDLTGPAYPSTMVRWLGAIQQRADNDDSKAGPSTVRLAPDGNAAEHRLALRGHFEESYEPQESSIDVFPPDVPEGEQMVDTLRCRYR